MNKNWKKVYSTQQPHLAEITKGVLQEHKIESVILSQRDSSYHFGEINVYTHEKNEGQALEIIKINNL